MKPLDNNFVASAVRSKSESNLTNVGTGSKSVNPVAQLFRRAGNAIIKFISPAKEPQLVSVYDQIDDLITNNTSDARDISDQSYSLDEASYTTTTFAKRHPQTALKLNIGLTNSNALSQDAVSSPMVPLFKKRDGLAARKFEASLAAVGRMNSRESSASTTPSTATSLLSRAGPFVLLRHDFDKPLGNLSKSMVDLSQMSTEFTAKLNNPTISVAPKKPARSFEAVAIIEKQTTAPTPAPREAKPQASQVSETFIKQPPIPAPRKTKDTQAV